MGRRCVVCSFLSFPSLSLPSSGNRATTIPNTQEWKKRRDRPPGAGGARREKTEERCGRAFSLSFSLSFSLKAQTRKREGREREREGCGERVRKETQISISSLKLESTIDSRRAQLFPSLTFPLLRLEIRETRDQSRSTAGYRKLHHKRLGEGKS